MEDEIYFKILHKHQLGRVSLARLGVRECFVVLIFTLCDSLLPAGLTNVFSRTQIRGKI